MNINFPNIDEARAAARLKNNIERLDRHEGKEAFMDVSGTDIYVRIDFGYHLPMEQNFEAHKVSEIDAFCRFLEGSEAKGVAALSSVGVAL
jgi:hypothetical protein